MLLDLFPQEQANAGVFASTRPIRGIDPGPGGTFVAEWNSLRARQSEGYAAQLRVDIVGERLDAYRAGTGMDLTNPEVAAAFPPTLLERVGNFLPGINAVPSRAEMDRSAREQTIATYNSWAQQNGQPLWPTSEELESEVLRRRQDVFNESQRISSYGTSAASWWGGTLGGIAGSLADPLVVATMAFGAGWATGIVRTVLIEAGIGFSTTAAVDLVRMNAIRQVDPDFDFGDVLAESTFAAAGAGVLGGAIKGIARAFQLIRGIPHPQRVRDAATAVEYEAANAEAAPRSVAATPAQAAAARASATQAAFDLGNDRPITVTREAAAAADARAGRVYDADGRAIQVQYEVVDASTLIASHTADFGVNPAYPAALQPRDRGRAASQDQVNAIAANLNPELLGVSPRADSGAPIVGPDGVIESGNGRVLGIMEAYRRTTPGGVAYIRKLNELGYDTDSFADPVLIARRVSALEEGDRVAFTRSANRSVAARMSPAETAAADARLLDAELLSRYVPDGEIGGAANRDFVRGFMRSLPETERSELMDRGGGLSVAGQRRITAAMLARAYGDASFLARTLEDADNNIKTIGNAMADASGPWAVMKDRVARGEIPRGMDITEDLLNAVRAVMRARDERVPVSRIANQAEMFDGPSEVSKLLLRGLFTDTDYRRASSRPNVAALLAGYAEAAARNEAGPRLFGEALGAGDILGTALRAAKREDLFDAAVAASRPENVEALATGAGADLVDDAIIREGEELSRTVRETGDGTGELVTIPIKNPDGTISRKTLDEVYAEADMEIAAAKDLEACATGAALPSEPTLL